MSKKAPRISTPRDVESEFNLRLHADRTTIGEIIARLGFTWDIFEKVIGANGKLRVSRVQPRPAARHAVYAEARHCLSADRIARAVRVPRSTVLDSYKSARRKNTT